MLELLENLLYEEAKFLFGKSILYLKKFHSIFFELDKWSVNLIVDSGY